MGIGNLVMTAADLFKAPFQNWGAEFGRRHDPALFMQEDGTPWLIYGATSIIKIKKDFSGYAGDPIEIWPSNRKIGHEGSHIIKIRDKYVLFGTAWSTDNMRHGTYNLYYCTSDSITGPYNERKFAGRFLGHGTLFQDKQGRWWCTAFYNADEPVLSSAEALSRDLSDSAYTINKQGLTLVPMQIKMQDGDVRVRAKDPAYAAPGPEEVQEF